ncbi:MAG: aminotransferase class I/II-fold pyridoxal phosphate-dependent enzyme [Anaerolineae bacterium]|nr:aminotransferase class I/II-fold pyridoxal phosphate-dependent enzyme [Anaerolineae bacterium]
MRWAPFALERFFARYEFSIDYVLCASDCESMTLGELLALEPGAAAAFQELWLGYTESAGNPELRQQIAAIYESIESDEVLVHSGAEEAIFLLMHALLEAGDHLVVQWPCYQSLAEVARGLGCQVRRWSVRASDGWVLDPDELERLVDGDTRLVVINTPHNPTGYHMPPQVYERVVELANTHGFHLFSDEVYRESEYKAGARLTASCDLGERMLSLGVMSKTYGLPGLRVGWLATHDAALLARVAQLKDYTTICNAAPSEFLATLALRHRARLAARSVALLRRNLVALEAFMAAHTEVFDWIRPQAGPIAFPRLVGSAAREGALAFCERTATMSGVLLLPGDVYDSPGHVRVGFGRRDMPAALSQLDAHLS